MRHWIGALAAGLAAGVLTAAAAAAQTLCTDIDSVQGSAQPTLNTQYGGQLDVYIMGQTPPHGMTQAKRTLFSSAGQFFSAFGALAMDPTPLYCADTDIDNTQISGTIALQQTSLHCAVADRVGRCLESRSVETYEVTFTMRVVNGVWIIYRAYPSQ
ncbi:MAG: hypothetical protein QNJ16_19745 [Rhodobacter sp.]|nr:hypothetical protein [Rhodobacter sp.]